MSTLQRRSRNRFIAHLLFWGAFAGVAAWSFYGSEFNLEVLGNAAPRMEEFFSRFVPPDWSVADMVFYSAVETLMIALAGTVLAVVISLPLGFLAASNISPLWFSASLKTLLGVIRSIPLIVVAVIFVSAVGLGPFPGALAIAFHSIGMLGKFYAEEFETADEGIIHAIEGTGAGWLQTMRYGLFSQSIPQVVSFTVYRFELNFRDATVLGLVGAGGIGYYIQAYVGSFQYEKVTVLLVIIALVVFALDQATLWVRKRVQ
jgi:phosphonate transport system permease protein